MKSKDLKRNVSAKRSPLKRVLKKNEKITETVGTAASELTLVNKVLKQEKVPVQMMEQAITQNEDVEQKVADAADDLKLVNVELAEEMAERIVIESELADTKTDLAEARDDLSRECNRGTPLNNSIDSLWRMAYPRGHATIRPAGRSRRLAPHHDPRDRAAEHLPG